MILPRNVTAMVDRHGKTRYRFRKAGLPSRYIPHPESSLFQEAFNACLRGEYTSPRKPTLRARAAMRRKAASPKSNYDTLTGVSVVYFIGGRRGPVKIGTTTNLKQRLKSLKIGSAVHLYVLACINGDASVEAGYHKAFASLKVRGEWFLGEQVRELIGRLISEGLCLTSNTANLANPKES